MTDEAIKNWVFEDAPGSMVYTVIQILEGWEPILRVTHDAEDNAWQFLPAAGSYKDGDARLISLKEIVSLDASICLLATLPVGWHAWRKAAHLPWQRSRILVD